MPTMCLGVPCSIMEGCKNSLMVITTHGQLYSWYVGTMIFSDLSTSSISHCVIRNVKKQCSNFPPISILTLYDIWPNISLVSASIRENGVPIVNCSNGVIYSYDPALSSWVKLADRWCAEGSDVWQGRQRGNSTTASRGIMASIESSIAGTPDEGSAEKPRPKWWSTAVTLGHLETRLHSTKLLDSPQEYRQALLLYAKKIADEGFKGKGEELVKELFGPVYWYVTICWRDLLNGRLIFFSVSRRVIGDLEEKIYGIPTLLDSLNVIY